MHPLLRRSVLASHSPVCVFNNNRFIEEGYLRQSQEGQMSEPEPKDSGMLVLQCSRNPRPGGLRRDRDGPLLQHFLVNSQRRLELFALGH